MTSTTHPATFLELRLYDNGMDFINKSMESFVEAIKGPSPIEYKYAITLLATGCELILKSLLEDVHPLFIEENLDSSTEKTVSAENLVSRINKIYNYENPKKRVQNLDIANLNAIRALRNKIIHKEVVFDNEMVIQKIYANALFSLDRIVKDFKQLTFSSEVDNWAYIVNIEPIQSAYYNSISGIKLNGTPIPCPICSIKKLANKMEKIECLHCGSNFSSLPEAINSLDDLYLKEELYLAFVYEKELERVIFNVCPSCHNEDYAWYDREKQGVICFECGPLTTTECKQCKDNSVATYYYHSTDNVEEVNYCFTCDETIDSEQCPNCLESFFKLREKIKIDVKKSETFYKSVSLKHTGDTPFIEVSLCPECHDRMLFLEEDGVIDII
ncbi:hypothetical protein [Bacillus cereus]|uniref:hypothetical protein n=1 Tax=Bacillus cereus TaxID=1396 RepID=UPI0018795E9E|nr:hypothetical protein [Bacillus cereus]MBE7099217.1 hypothetical protein [Bacillus cereus]